jgi:MFS family permease
MMESLAKKMTALAPLRHPVFRMLWIASVVSHIGSYMTDVGQGWLMATLSPSPLLIALLVTAESMPFFALGLPAGALADIIDRRRLLLVTQLAMAIVLATLAATTIAGAITPSLLLLLAFILGTANAFNDPAWHAAIPELLPKEELPLGVTLNGVGINVARTLGPALGGLVVATAGPGVVFIFDSLTFVGVVAVLFSWRREHSPSVLPAERMLGAIRSGFRFARHSDSLRRVLVRAAAFMACGSGIMALMPVLARETHYGAVGLGFLLGSVGLGAVAGAVLLPAIRAKTSIDNLITWGSLALAAVALAAAALRALAVLSPFMIAGGFAWIAVLSSLNVAAQQASPTWVKARALSVYLIVFQAALAAGSALWGAVAARSNLSAAYLGIAVGLAAGGMLLRRLKLASVEGVDHTPTHHWPDPSVTGELGHEAGPIMVLVEYTVDAPNAGDFRTAMGRVGLSRRRYGAFHWSLFQDTADPTRFVESWVVDTWAEHLRHHQRVSVADQELEKEARMLVRPGSRVEIRHFISSRPHSRSDGTVRTVLDRTGAAPLHEENQGLTA